MNRWLHKLTKKEILQLHNDVICDDCLKKCDIYKGVNNVTNETEVECTFYEDWGMGDEKDYIPHHILLKIMSLSIGKHQAVIGMTKQNIAHGWQSVLAFHILQIY